MSDLKNNVVPAIQGNAVSPNRPLVGQWYAWDGTEFSLTTYPNSFTLENLTVTNSINAPGLTNTNIGLNATTSITLSSTSITLTTPDLSTSFFINEISGGVPAININLASNFVYPGGPGTVNTTTLQGFMKLC